MEIIILDIFLRERSFSSGYFLKMLDEFQKVAERLR